MTQTVHITASSICDDSWLFHQSTDFSCIWFIFTDDKSCLIIITVTEWAKTVHFQFIISMRPFKEKLKRFIEMFAEI